jgi:drug/metabolite transporter (DMT)-like permease
VLAGTERGLRPVRLGGLLVGFAGTLLIFAPWQQSGLASWGALALVGAAASYAVAYAYMARFLVSTGAGALSTAAAQLVAATALSAPALAAGGPAPQLTPGVVAAVAVLGIAATGLTFALNVRLIADEGPTTAATVGYLLPVVSLALGAAVLGESLGVRIVAGMVVVLVGVGLTRVGQAASARGAGPTTSAGPPGPPEPSTAKGWRNAYSASPLAGSSANTRLARSSLTCTSTSSATGSQ